MNTERFELTDQLRERIAEIIQSYHYEVVRFHNKDPKFTMEKKAQSLSRYADQILSLFEPVELEALGDEEVDNLRVPPNELWNYKAHMRNASQATIKKNQSKGQLYRLKEREANGEDSQVC